VKSVCVYIEHYLICTSRPAAVVFLLFQPIFAAARFPRKRSLRGLLEKGFYRPDAEMPHLLPDYHESWSTHCRASTVICSLSILASLLFIVIFVLACFLLSFFCTVQLVVNSLFPCCSQAGCSTVKRCILYCSCDADCTVLWCCLRAQLLCPVATS